MTRLKSGRFALVFIFISVLALTGCDKGFEPEPELKPKEEYPYLKIENQLNSNWRSITGVLLVGYEFENLKIEPKGDSQTFVLDKGMPGGYEKINVKVLYKASTYTKVSASIKVNFNKGDTTTITLTGCDGEGCPGFYLVNTP